MTAFRVLPKPTKTTLAQILRDAEPHLEHFAVWWGNDTWVCSFNSHSSPMNVETGTDLLEVVTKALTAVPTLEPFKPVLPMKPRRRVLGRSNV